MDIKAILTEHGVDTEAIAKLSKAIETAVGNEFVEKQRYKDKLSEIETLKTSLKTAEDDVTTADTYKQKHDALQAKYDADIATKQKEFDDFKVGIENEKANTAQDKALYETLKSAGANEKLIPLLLKDIDRTKAKFDGDIDKGFTIKNADDIFKPLKEKFSEVFGTVQTVGAGVATPPKAEGGKPDYISQLEAARKSGNTQDAVRIKTEAAKEGVFLI